MDGQVQHPAAFKFFGEQGEAHGGKLSWPGVYGIPFRTTTDNVPIVDGEIRGKLYCVGDAWHAILDLSKEEDSRKFCWIRDRIRNGWFILDYIDRRWDIERRTMLIYIEWTQVYMALHNPT